MFEGSFRLPVDGLSSMITKSPLELDYTLNYSPGLTMPDLLEALVGMSLLLLSVPHISNAMSKDNLRVLPGCQVALRTRRDT